MFTRFSVHGTFFNVAGLFALPNLKGTAIRTALTGSASFLDIFFITPGMHIQRYASNVNGGEYPTAGLMTTGRILRVENQATIGYLKTIGKTGHLATVRVSHRESRSSLSLSKTEIIAHLLYLAGVGSTIASLALLGVIGDWWTFGVISILLFARALNVAVLKCRMKQGWKGALEPDIEGDILILLTQDRWIRMRGMLDDLKSVVEGLWLREETIVESLMTNVATLLVYCSAVLSGNASAVGSFIMVALLLISAGLLELSNAATKATRALHMFDGVLRLEGRPKRYSRRLEMARDLVIETRREDWALGLGLIKAPVLYADTPTDIVELERSPDARMLSNRR